MKRNPTLIEGSFIAVLLALLITSAVILAGYESRKIIPLQVAETPQPPSENAIPTEKPEVFTEITIAPTEEPSPTVCPIPEGWQPYEMKIGDSLEGLAGERLSQLTDVMAGNCLTRPGALPGTILYLPPPPPTLTPTITSTPTITPTPTITLRACNYPEGWVRYSLKPGDTLFKLGVLYHTSEVDLLTGNCLAFGTALHAGDILLVPPPSTATPFPKK